MALRVYYRRTRHKVCRAVGYRRIGSDGTALIAEEEEGRTVGRGHTKRNERRRAIGGRAAVKQPESDDNQKNRERERESLFNGGEAHSAE